MDSAFLHARSLYEFFTASGQKSLKCRKFRKPLHGRVMHLNNDRAGYKEIKNEVVNVATDILNLWNQFSKKLGVERYSSSLLNKYRDLAIAEAHAVAEQYRQYGFRSPFS